MISAPKIKVVFAIHDGMRRNRARSVTSESTRYYHVDPVSSPGVALSNPSKISSASTTLSKGSPTTIPLSEITNPRLVGSATPFKSLVGAQGLEPWAR